jgi:hypothetical protein
MSPDTQQSDVPNNGVRFHGHAAPVRDFDLSVMRQDADWITY